MARFSLELLRAAQAKRDAGVALSLSRANELLTEHRVLGAPLLEVDTFAHGSGMLTGAWRIAGLRRTLQTAVATQGIDWVVNLMPHVWTPLMVGAAQRAGAGYATIIHDAAPHPGDLSALALTWCNREALAADRVLTLSEAVRGDLLRRWPNVAGHTTALFPPDMPVHSRPLLPTVRSDGTPFQLLFFGRILPYKGLPLLVEAVEQLVARGLPIKLRILGEGDIAGLRPRLAALGAQLDIGWFRDETLAQALADADAVALSHTEASQSGVASVAAAAGVPVVATPVGALGEQVRDDQEGLLAAAATPGAFADALEQLILSPDRRAAIRRHLALRRETRSMSAFIDALRDALAAAAPTKTRRAGASR